MHIDYSIATADLFCLQTCAAVNIISETLHMCMAEGLYINWTCSKGTAWPIVVYT